MSSSPASVLIVNDVPDQLGWMSALLSGAGYSVHTALDADSAFRTAGQIRPTLVVSDVSMPGRDGVELCRMIRADSGLFSTPVLLFSALRRDSGSMVEGLQAGASDYIEAPCDPQLLLVKVEQLIRLKRAEEALRESEDRYRDLVEHGNELICTHDLDGRILSVNPWAAKALGVAQASLLGGNIRDVLTPEARKGFADYLRRVREEGAARGLMLVRTVSGEERVWKYHNTLRTEGVSAPIVRGMAHDVTDLKRAEERLRQSVERFDLVARATNDTIWDWNLDTGGLWWNENFQSMFAYAPGDVGPDSRFWESGVHPDDYDRVVNGIHALIESGGQTWADEYRFRRGDGTYAFVSDRGYVVRDASGRPERMVGSMTDITERRRREEQLRFQAGALSQVRDAVVAVDLEHRVTYWNSGAERMYGVGAGEALGSKLTDLYQFRWLRPEDEQAAFDSFRNTGSWSGHNIHVTSGGVEIYVESTVSVLKDGEADAGFLAVIRDVTERRRADAALRESEARYRGLVDALPAIVYVAQPVPPYSPVYVNLGIETLGYSTREWYGSPDLWVRLLHPEDREWVLRETEAAMAEGRSNDYEYRMVARDGRVRWFHDRGAFLVDERGERTAWQGVMVDVTESKRALEDLDRFFSLSRDMLCIAHFGGFFRRLNPAWEETLGWTREELTSKPFLDFVHPEDHEKTVAETARLAGGDVTVSFENRYLCRDGSYKWLLWSCTPSPEHGLIYAVAHDITSRKRDEELMLRISSAVESTRDAIGIADRDRKSIYHNRAAVELFGYTPDELNERGGPSTLYADGGVAREVWEQLTAGGSWSGHTEVLGRAGEKIPVSLSASAVRDRKGESVGFIAIWSDLRERLHIEEQLRQSQKMEAVGTLAGGVAHDFNNLLTAITGYTDLSMKKLRDDDPLHRNLSEVAKAASRATSLTRQLLAFSRRQVLRPQVLDLNAVVSDMQRMLSRLIGEDVELKTVLDPALGSVRADPGQVEQVILNLAVNARDAMPEGGTLTLETLNVHVDAEYAARHIAVTPGPYVMLAVSDTGVGMDAATKGRVFEPFFTTKEPGKGTGLGLSTLYGIVKQSGGNVWVYSEPGEGTSFKVYLPRVDEEASQYRHHGGQTEAPRGTETVLLVEDEEVVRGLARQILEGAGYKVLAAAHGGAALLLCERHEGEIDLLLTDVVMPEMSGRQLAERLAGVRPGMKVVYMSGYTADAVVRRGVIEDEASFVQKPFTPDDLLRKVREGLDAPQ